MQSESTQISDITFVMRRSNRNEQKTSRGAWKSLPASELDEFFLIKAPPKPVPHMFSHISPIKVI